MDNLTENKQAAAEGAEAQEKIAAAELGKFKDVKTLLKAYSDLEAEFTRRCQRLKELEAGNKAGETSDGTLSLPSPKSGDERIAAALADEQVRDAVISDYLKKLAEKSVPLASGGGGVAAPRTSPKSVKEAGRLAERFLNG